jgi:Spy/CpxP family protein refolding chaperone
MNTKSKAALALIATLLLGIVIGVLSHAAIMRPPIDRHRPRMNGDRLASRLERLLDVAPEQREAVREILDHHVEQIMAMNREHGEELGALMDTLMEELSAVLTEEQLKPLKEHRDRRRDGRHGPPPFMRPPKPGGP